ncbi:hypothetical protein [Geomobilimonas luticola]|uniref:TolA protein n=1 Tax=Geomobilimonas luticola TaxID=1114878 RepID=A0ABS5SE75_9BACT|nr:hypothetical protein [Geomobilimonas luticola]MBT0652952.1 hypothetical protein [Geomobilimonas luticola]
MKRQKPPQHHRESIDLGCAIFSSLLFHIVLFLVLASTSIFYPAVGSAMRFDFIWLDPSLTPATKPEPLTTEDNVTSPSLAVTREAQKDATEKPLAEQKSEDISTEPLPAAPEPPDAPVREDDPEQQLELVRIKEAIKPPVPAPVKPLPASKPAPDLKAERERRLAEEERLKAARAEAERLRVSVERSRREHLARERAEQLRKESEQLAALKAEQELKASEEARIKADQAEAERVRELAEQARQERLSRERAEQQRKANEREAALKIEQERIAAEEAQLQAAQAEADRLRQAAERARQERMSREKAEQKRRAAEQAARLKVAQEQREAKEAQLKAKREEAERQHQAAERARQERQARQRAEELRNKAEQAAKLKADREREAAEDARQKIAQEEAERLRRVAERSRQERLAREQAEKQRKAAEMAAEQERRSVEEARRNAENERLAQKKALLEKAAAMHKVAATETAPQKTSANPSLEKNQEVPVARVVKASSEQKPATPKPEKKGIIIPAVHGDLKLVVICKSSLKIATTFRAYPKSRRNRPQTLNEVRQEKNITPLMVTQSDDTREAIIERSQEGIYTFIAEPADETTPKSNFVLKIFESTSKTRTRPIGDKTVVGKTVITKVLMPEGILWEDESAFTGSIEDSSSITKFNAETGLIWKEFSN